MAYANNFQINGEWQQYFIGDGFKVATRLQVLHRSILSRKSDVARRGSTHIYENYSVSEEFKDFQFFADWCVKQIGFGNHDENLKSWAIDKDILFKGNKIYGPEVCVFLPNVLNCLISKRINKKSNLPPGVNKSCKSYIAMCSDAAGVHVYLGSYKLVNDAFMVYKEFKEKVIKERANQFREVIDPRAYHALMNWKIEVTD